MAETQQTKAPAAPMPAGGTVLAVVPQSVEEIQRVSNMVIASGIAPAGLVKKAKDTDSAEQVKLIAQMNIAAVATAIMAGAELGLPPMVALRSFTVINGRPALYADGNVAVVRKARSGDGTLICRYIRHGWDQTDSDETTGAWCEAARNDNDEVHREFFSVADAKRSGLWDDKATVEGEVWAWDEAAKKRKPHKEQIPNPAPWHRFPKRMCMWRAVGYCLRWLFADVLGGMPDEYEARDIERMIDITPEPTTRPQPSGPKTDLPDIDLPGDDTDPPTPTDQQGGGGVPPASAANEPEQVARKDVGSGTGASAADVDQSGSTDAEDNQDGPAFVPTGEITPDVEKYLLALSVELASAIDEASIEELFDRAEPQTRLAGNQLAIAKAFQIKADYINALASADRAELEAAGQQSMFE